MDKNQNVTILDCTLRDGSYVIDYQFNVEDTYIICLGLKMAGFKFVEIGHGSGFRSSQKGLGTSAATDEEYLNAARSAIGSGETKFGMFFIPGIGTMEDLELGAKCEMGFVRIGVNVTEIEKAKPYIKKAKKLGLVVSTNLMKSYAVAAPEFVRLALKADQYGTDIISIVDSAGGMFPTDVREYVGRLKDKTKKQVGFHGHNNLHMAMANTLEAINCGSTIVDSSLHGMGRSAGNTQTEILVMVLEKMGIKTGINPYQTLDLGERIIRPMIAKWHSVDDVAIVSGIAQFHSSFNKLIWEAAEKYGIDQRVLIMEVSAVERIHLTAKIVNETALKIKSRKNGVWKKNNVKFKVDASLIEKQVTSEPLDHLCSNMDKMFTLSRKTGKETVLSLTIARDHQSAFPFVRQNAGFVIGNVEAKDIQQIKEFVKLADGKMNWILLDESVMALWSVNLNEFIMSSRWAWYSEERALRLSVSALLSLHHPRGKVLVLSDKDNIQLLKLAMKQLGMLVFSISDEPGDRILPQINAIVSFGQEFAKSLSKDHVSFISDKVSVYVARPHAFPASFWEALLLQNNFVCRVDTRIGLAVELSLAIETKRTALQMGAKDAFNTQLVSGGVIAKKGSVVVDSVQHPTRLIGIADGEGGLLPLDEEKKYQKTKTKILEEMVKSLYQRSL